MDPRIQYAQTSDGVSIAYGHAVNTVRISGLSVPGEVLFSDTVLALARTSSDVTFDDRGEQWLKGVGEPVRVYVARWRVSGAD